MEGQSHCAFSSLLLRDLFFNIVLHDTFISYMTASPGPGSSRAGQVGSVTSGLWVSYSVIVLNLK